jgi:acetylglutamate kinase
MDMNNYMERSTVLVEALPYIQKYYGKTVVIKYGGNAMISEELRTAVISDIILLHLVGVHVVVVHGGGPEIGQMLEKIGKKSHFVDGLRYTDEETMDIVQQILCGKVNKSLVSIINMIDPEMIVLGGGVSGAGQFLLDAVRTKMESMVFYKGMDYAKIELAVLGNDAGIIGAAMLGK